MTIKFTIKSTELRDYDNKHNCNLIGAVNDNKILVEVLPPIPGFLYDFQYDLERLVLAPRFEGSYLVPQISEWPCRVYMCIPEKDGTWDEGPYKILDWGIIELL